MKKYLSSTIDYFETDKYIFVHGWIPCFPIYINEDYDHPIYKYDAEWRNGSWKNSRWYCGFDAWHDGVTVEGKTIICGHWHTSYAHKKYHNKGYEDIYEFLPLKKYICFDPFIDEGIIGIDACTITSGQVNCITLKDKNLFKKGNIE